jgi:hypothetical protein
VWARGARVGKDPGQLHGHQRPQVVVKLAPGIGVARVRGRGRGVGVGLFPAMWAGGKAWA